MTTITEFRQPLRVAYLQMMEYLEKEDPNKLLTAEDWKYIYNVCLPLMDKVTHEAWPERAK